MAELVGVGKCSHTSGSIATHPPARRRPRRHLGFASLLLALVVLAAAEAFRRGRK
jgi:hypothetical protein